MIVRRLAVKDFRRFAQLETRFAPGLNVILGNNEEGKSTLREAIAVALFRDPKTTDKEILSLRRWGADEAFALELELDDGGETYVLTKDFQARSARLVERGSGRVMQDPRAVEARIKELLGLPSRAVFESTVRISQRDVTNIQKSKEIADRLQGLVTGGEQDVQASKVLADLDRALNGLRSESKSNPGPLAVLPEQIARKEETLAAKRQSLGEAVLARGRLAQAEHELREARAELAEKRGIAEACARRLRLTDELEQLVRAEEELDGRIQRIRQESDAVQRDQSELGAYAAALALPAERVAEISALEAELRKAAAATPERAAVDEREAAGFRRGVLVLGAALLAVGLVGGLWYPPLFSLLLLGALALVWEAVRSMRDTVGVAVLVAQQRIQARIEDADRAARELKEMLAEAGCAMAAELRERRAAADELQRSIDRARSRLEVLLGGQTVEQMEEERRAISRRIVRLQEELAKPEMRLAQMDQAAYRRLTADISRGERQVQALEERMVGLRVDAGVKQVGADEVHAFEEELQELNERLDAAQERKRVLSLAREVLDEARMATLRTARNALESELTAVIEEITGGRYSQVAVDSSLGIWLKAPEKDDDLVAVTLDGALSTGTVEQVYLAARLALMRLLAQGRRPPLILDDPFVAFDAPRTAAVLRLCQRLSAEHQILLFTCRPDYAAVADNLVVLPPVAGPSSFWDPGGEVPIL